MTPRRGFPQGSLPVRLVVGMLGLVLVALAAFAIATATLLRSFQLDQVDAELRARSDGITRVLDEGANRAFANRPPGGFERLNAQRLTILTVGRDGTVQALIRSGASQDGDPLPDVDVDFNAPAQYDQPFTVEAQGDPSFRYRVLVMFDSTHERAVVAAAPLAAQDDTIERLLLIEGVLALVIVLLAAVAGWRVVRVGLRPLDRMTETATAIAAGDLSHRVELQEERADEVGRLGLALNSMLEQIEGAFHEREEADAHLRQFMADASHELRTPLTSIRGYAELYRGGMIADDDAVGDAMGRIEGEAVRMTTLVDDLLLLARLDQGRPLERQPVDLVAVGRDATRDLQAAAPDRVVTFEHDDDVGMMGDPARLHQAIANLLDNARVHTPPGSPIHLTIRTDNEAAGDHVVVAVADEGPGLDAAAATHVFERSFRADTEGRHAGSGLGLSIVAAIANAHGGQASASSAPGAGSVFTLRLPIAGRP